jgi:hypothetical protein
LPGFGWLHRPSITLALLAISTFNGQISTVKAQGTAFTYQGQLNSNGSSANGVYDLQFTLFDAAQNGNQIGAALISSAVTVNNGAFATTLDFGPGVFAGPSRWLAIGARSRGGGTFTALTPVQQITPAPYAIFAETSGNVGPSSVTAAQLNTASAPASGQVLSCNGSSLVWANPAGGSASGWSLTGNSGTIPGVDFLGTTDYEPLELWVDGSRAFRLEPANGQPNVVGGSGTTVSPGAAGATIGGGTANTISPDAAGTASNPTIGGGTHNMVYGDYATVPGGLGNVATGYCSFAAGHLANASQQGAFVWADSQPDSFFSGGNDSFSIRAQGGVQLDPSTSLFFGSQTRQMLNLYGTAYGIGVQNETLFFRSDGNYANSGDFSWFRGGSFDGDQNQPGSGGQEMMRLDHNGNLSVASLPITRCHFTNDVATAHLGPMAQDFYAAFNVGSDEKHIAVVDEGGVALAAIQGLNEKLEQKEARIQQQGAEIQELKQSVADLKKMVQMLAERR